MMTIEQATSLYFGIHNQPTGDTRADLIAAGQVAHRWITVGPEATAVILHALSRHFGMTLRQIEAETGIPRENVRNKIAKLEAGIWGAVPEVGPSA